MPPSPDAAAQVPAPSMSQAGRLVNVIIDPKPAFADIAARPGWWVPIILIVVCSLAFTFAFSSHVGWGHFMQQQFDKSPQAQKMEPEARERALEMQTKFLGVAGPVFAVVAAPVVMLIQAGTLMFVFIFMLGATVKFRQAFAVAAYAALPSVVATLANTLVMFLKDPSDFDLSNPAGFNLGFYLDPHAVPAWLVSIGNSIDVFAFWTMLLLATGMAAVTKKRWTTALTGVLIPWAAYVLLKAGAAALFS